MVTNLLFALGRRKRSRTVGITAAMERAIDDEIQILIRSLPALPGESGTGDK